MNSATRRSTRPGGPAAGCLERRKGLEGDAKGWEARAHCRVARDALGGEAPQRRPHRRFDRRLEEVAKAVGGGYCH